MRAGPTAQREGGSTDCLPLPPHSRGLDSSHNGQQTALQGLPLSQAGCQAPAGFPDPGYQPPLPYPTGNDICQDLRHGSVSPRSYPRYHKRVLGTTVARRFDRWHMRDGGYSMEERKRVIGFGSSTIQGWLPSVLAHLNLIPGWSLGVSDCFPAGEGPPVVCEGSSHGTALKTRQWL